VYWSQLSQDRDQWRALVEYCNEPLGSIKCWEFLDQSRNYQLFEKDSAPCSKLVSNY
jgi:hypothetical protein